MQVIKDQADISCELAHFLSNATHSFGFNDAYGKSPQSGHVFRAMAGSYTAAVFIIIPIDDVMATVFDTPVTSVGGKNTFGVGLLRGAAGNAVGDFTGGFTAFFIREVPLNDKSLSNVGKIEIAVEFGCGPDFTDFDPTVVRRVAFDIIRHLSVFKVQSDVLKKSGLVVFNGKMEMSFAFDYVVCDLALGQQGIRGNFLAVDIDGGKKRNRGFDFIGAFDGLIIYGQGADFFWV